MGYAFSYARCAVPSDGGSSRDIVLLVDDKPETLGAVIEALEEANVTALIARDGPSALQILERIQPDLILLDAVMPTMDGFATCRKIKALPNMATTPVVFMTGLSDSEHVLEGLKAGGVDYVSKPVNPEEIIARITVHISNARMVAEARSALDTADQGVVAFRANGEVAWSSPHAAALLDLSPGAWKGANGEAQATWLRRAETAPITSHQDLELKIGKDAVLRLELISRSATGDILTRISVSEDRKPAEILETALGVTAREAEVLAWLANGKSNADIALILNLSPRTVTKHVEKILIKLGVENRTSAAAAAIRLMMAHGPKNKTNRG